MQQISQMQRCRDAEMQRCRDAEMQRCRDAEMQRCRDAEMQRCRDAEIQQISQMQRCSRSLRCSGDAAHLSAEMQQRCSSERVSAADSIRLPSLRKNYWLCFKPYFSLAKYVTTLRISLQRCSRDAAEMQQRCSRALPAACAAKLQGTLFRRTTTAI